MKKVALITGITGRDGSCLTELCCIMAEHDLQKAKKEAGMA